MGGPIITESDSRTLRWLVLAVAVTLLAGGSVLYFALSDGSGHASVGTVAADAAIDSEPLATDTDGSDTEPTADTWALDDVDDADDAQEPGGTSAGAPASGPAAAPDLLLSSAEPALAGLVDAIGSPFQARQLVLYEDYAILEYQDPGTTTHIDRLVWRADRLVGPDPVSLPGGFDDDVEAELFPLDPVRLDLLPGLVDAALAEYELEQPVPTHVIVGRFLPWDRNVNIRVYVSDPDRGGGGYVRFSATGDLIDVVG